ncbi:hypothetical protein ACVJGB_006938 [Bradyrhizobium liaoningense]
MRTQPKNPRQKPGRKSPAKGDQAKKRAKNRKTRPHSILLADLFLLIRVVDECLYHPTGALGRAAKTEGYGSVGNVAQRLDVLENRFGKLFYRNSSGGRRRADPRGDGRQGARLRSRAEDARADAQEPAQRLFPRQARLLPGEGQYRSGVPNFRAAALAELFAVIELLYSRAWSFGRAGFLDELHKLKEIIVPPIAEECTSRAGRFGPKQNQGQLDVAYSTVEDWTGALSQEDVRLAALQSVAGQTASSAFAHPRAVTRLRPQLIVA